MQRKNTFIYTSLLLGSITLGYALWFYLRPVKIVSVHEDGHFSSVLVRNFPFTDKGKINWWLKNKDMLQEKYHIPKPAPYGNFTITFWIFGKGYKEQGKYDRFCFNDMKEKTNCIEKEAVFSVSKSNNSGTMFTVYDGTYALKENGKVVKYAYK